MMILHGTVIACKIWCHDSKLKEIGVDTSLWLDFGIDLKSVFAMKINGEGDTEFEKEAEHKSTLYTPDGVFTVDIDFAELFPEWIRIKRDAP